MPNARPLPAAVLAISAIDLTGLIEQRLRQAGTARAAGPGALTVIGSELAGGERRGNPGPVGQESEF